MRARPRSVDRGTCRPGIQPQQTDTRVVRQGPWRGLRVTVICTPYARSGRITAETSARFLATSSRTRSPGRGQATLFQFVPECGVSRGVLVPVKNSIRPTVTECERHGDTLADSDSAMPFLLSRPRRAM